METEKTVRSSQVLAGIPTLLLCLASLAFTANLIAAAMQLYVDRYLFYGLYPTAAQEISRGLLYAEIGRHKLFFLLAAAVLVGLYATLKLLHGLGDRGAGRYLTIALPAGGCGVVAVILVYFLQTATWLTAPQAVFLALGLAVTVLLPAVSASGKGFVLFRRANLVLIGLFLCSVVFCHAYQHFSRKSDGETPNIFLIVLDTLRGDVLSLYGAPEDRSPQLAEFAKDGVLFKNTFSQHPSTAPSIKSMLTSLYPKSIVGDTYTGSNFKSIRREYLLLPEILSDQGFRTIAFTDGGGTNAVLGFDQGFDHYHSFYEEDKDIKTKLNRFKAYYREHEELRSEPFFAFLHTYQIHAQYIKNEPYQSMYYDDLDITKEDRTAWEVFKTVYAPIYYKPYRGQDELAAQKAKHILERYDSGKRMKANYEGGVRYADEELGRFFDWLKKEELYDDALIIVTSDHGEMFLEHLSYWGHGKFLFDELLRVPLMVKFPGGRHGGKTVEGLVGLIDLVPTICECLNIDSSRFIHQGRSLLKTFDKVQPRIIFSEESFIQMVSAADGEKKYIYPKGEEHLRRIKSLVEAKEFLDYFSGGVYTRKDDTEVFETADKDRVDKFWHPLLTRWEEDCNSIKEKIIRKALPFKTSRRTGISEEDQEEYLKQLRDLGYIY